jgi:hypothetical protein
LGTHLDPEYHLKKKRIEELRYSSACLLLTRS